MSWWTQAVNLRCGQWSFPAPRGLAQSGQLALLRLVQRLDVAGTEGARAVPLDELEEQGAAHVHGLREDLEHQAPVVAVDQHTQLAQGGDVHVLRGQPVAHDVVVAGRGGRETDPTTAEGAYRADDVTGTEGEVLHARA